jgi:TRAP-type C4-dicarboxylate transport system permease small subunit
MTRQTKRLRVLLVMFLAGLVLASGVLYIASLDYAALSPELASLRLPIYVAVLVGLVPMLFAAALELRQDNELTV